jgi:predicted aspartyl protease
LRFSAAQGTASATAPFLIAVLQHPPVAASVERACAVSTIRSLKVGDRTITDVRASIADVNGSLLLGQSFLNKFKPWSQDNATHELVLQ